MTELFILPDGDLRWFDPALAPNGAKRYKAKPAENTEPEAAVKAVKPRNKAVKTATK